MARKVNHSSKRQWKIRKARQKENNPLLYHYNIKKQSAKQSGKDFTLTFQQWCDIWKNDIVKLKKDGFTLDRKNPKKGYTKANTRLLQFSDNYSNGATIDKQIHNGTATQATKNRKEKNEPFTEF
jgi:hypothetical protein